MDAVSRIADAVLYEGYILWPYRRSAMKNQQRWTFGGVYPRAHSDGREDDPWTMQTQCLLEAGAGARVDVGVRFLHVVERQVARVTADGLDFVDELTIGDERHVAWDEATERTVEASDVPVAELESPGVLQVDVPAGTEREELLDPGGPAKGLIVRSWRALGGTVEIRAEPLRPGLYRLTVWIENTTPWEGGDREDALRQTFCSTHTVLHVTDGEFVSVTDPPADVRDLTEALDNAGTWPVLVGEEGARDMLLSSPIILPDYPKIAPESPGDLFDGGEIDQLLTLSILSMTEEERREMRESDPRAREILERTESLSDEQLMKLHGAIRDFQSVRAQ